jgi:hypothetical protein
MTEMAKEPSIDVRARRILNGETLQGEPKELGNIGVCDAGRDRGTLYLLVHAQGARRAYAESLLVETITEFYKKIPGSMTGALMTAIRQGNAVLCRDNHMSMRNEQTLAGVYCAVVRPEHDLVLAYAGPSVALMVSEDRSVEHLPSGMEQVMPSESDRAQKAGNSLGINLEIEPYLFSSGYQPGDMLVLGSPSLLDSTISDEELANALYEEGVDGVPPARDLTALSISYLPAGVEPHHEPDVAPPPPLQSAPRNLSAGQVVRTLSGLFKPKAQPAPAEPEPTDQASPTEAPPAAAEAPAGIPSWVESTGAIKQEPERETEKEKEQGESNPPSRSLPSLSIPKLSMPQVMKSRAWLLLVPVAIVLLAVFAVWWQGKQQADTKNKQFQALVSQAEVKRTQAQTTFDRPTAINIFKDAQSLVDQALTIKKDDPAAVALRDTIAHDMDDIRLLTRLDASQVTTLATFTTPGAALSDVVSDGSSLFVLDQGSQKVYRFLLNAQGSGLQPTSTVSILLSKGDQIGGIVIGDLINMTIIPSGNARRMVVLESGGNLVQYDPASGLKILPVKDSLTWRKAQAIGGYSGNFYVLDTLANNILRYRPDTRGYEGTPSSYLLDKVELVNAVDMAIDGDFYVLMVNGQIVWLTGGKQQQFTIEGLDQPMAAPVAIYTTDTIDSLFISDPGNARIVRLTKQGALQHQYVLQGDSGGGFQRLRGIFVDEKNNGIFAIAGTNLLYMAMGK